MVELTDRTVRMLRRRTWRMLRARGVECEVTATRTSLTIVPLAAPLDGPPEDAIMSLCAAVARGLVAQEANVHMTGHEEFDANGNLHLWAHVIGEPPSAYMIEVVASPITGECRCNY